MKYRSVREPSGSGQNFSDCTELHQVTMKVNSSDENKNTHCYLAKNSL